MIEVASNKVLILVITKPYPCQQSKHSIITTVTSVIMSTPGDDMASTRSWISRMHVEDKDCS